MKIGGIIFSRMSSSRLPGKAMIDINGQTLLERVIERSKKISNIDHLCIATSNKKEDDVIESFAKSQNIDVYRGSLNDVALRAVEACTKFNYNNFLRICGDRPFFDIDYYNYLIENHLTNNNDLTTNIYPRTVPAGLTGEVISFRALKYLISQTSNKEEREHVTTFFYRNSNLFTISNISFNLSDDIIDLRLVIDDDRDLKRSCWISKNLENQKNTFNTKQIFSLAFKWEENNKIK